MPFKLFIDECDLSPIRFPAGVLSMAWCPSDSGLLLTSSKDNRTVCWDTAAGEVRRAEEGAATHCGFMKHEGML